MGIALFHVYMKRNDDAFLQERTLTKEGDTMERIIQQVIIADPEPPKATRVAAYVRISSAKEEMLHSLSAQISHYTEYIQNHPGWLFAGIYFDEAKTGTKENRDGFTTLLKDCHAGMIDLILVKSISRLARNSVALWHITLLSATVD